MERLFLIGQARFLIVVKANAGKNEIIGYDDSRKAYLVNIKAKPEGNKANIEIIKFLSRTLGKKVRIAKGLKSKEKLIVVG